MPQFPHLQKKRSTARCIALNLEGLPEITLIPSRGRRKTISLCIHDNGRITLRFPARLGIGRATDFIRSKTKWLEKKLLAFRSNSQGQETDDFYEGRPIPYLGRHFPLSWNLPQEESSAGQLVFTGEKFILPAHLKGAAEELFLSWYKKAASDVLMPTVTHYSALMHAVPKNIRVSSARSRWGSCSAKDTLSFSWRIALLPQDIIDYIVVHELAHLTHKNHGRAFWDTVGNFIHGYRTKNKWLRNYRCRGPAWKIKKN